MSFQTNSVNSTAVRAATCRDADLARYINFALQRYIHDMDQLTKSILNQVDLLQPNSYEMLRSPLPARLEAGSSMPRSSPVPAKGLTGRLPPTLKSSPARTTTAATTTTP